MNSRYPAARPQPTLRSRQQAIATQIAMLERTIHELKNPNKPGHHWMKITKVVNAVTYTEWCEVPDDYQPEPTNRPVQPPAQFTRTVSKPAHATWKAMDRRNWHRTGAPWHTCPNCTTYEHVHQQATTRAYDGRTGDLIPDLTNTDVPAEHIERMTDYKDVRTTPPPMHTRSGEVPRPVTGMNLFRHVNGHEECWDCGWKGEPVDAVPTLGPIRNATKHTIHSAGAIDRKALIAEYMRNNPVNNQGDTK